MQNEKTVFAFKLAEKKDAAPQTGKWKARDGVSVAGCTDQTGDGDYRAEVDIWGQYRGVDNGYWC
ncbi:hypothetical protein [Phenylobacterium sp.]|uniref:hypothetical protein n=1 Tax=Phenylobacterium sp. TaxID=1871053 RepID=UPI002FC99B68